MITPEKLGIDGLTYLEDARASGTVIVALSDSDGDMILVKNEDLVTLRDRLTETIERHDIGDERGRLTS